jgi:hypothetical protein
MLFLKHLKIFYSNKKLNNKFQDSHVINQVVKKQAYKLKLFMQMQIYLIFYISLLKSYHSSKFENDLFQKSDILNDDLEYQVDKIINDCIHYCIQQYIV